MFALSWLKLLALVMAVVTGILEEVFFRKVLMDYLQRQAMSPFVQVAGPALVFGALHASWGLFKGSLHAAAGASVATGLLGAGLAVTYIAAGRSLAPCVIAHVVINMLLEPGLVLAATRGEMGVRQAPGVSRVTVN